MKSKERLASLIDVIDTRLKNTAPAHALIAPEDWKLLKPLLLAGLSTHDVRSEAASWLEEMHDYARPIDQPKLLEAAAIIRAADKAT